MYTCFSKQYLYFNIKIIIFIRERSTPFNCSPIHMPSRLQYVFTWQNVCVVAHVAGFWLQPVVMSFDIFPQNKNIMIRALIIQSTCTSGAHPVFGKSSLMWIPEYKIGWFLLQHNNLNGCSNCVRPSEARLSY